MMLSFIDKRVVLYYKAQLILAFSYLLWNDLARIFHFLPPTVRKSINIINVFAVRFRSASSERDPLEWSQYGG